MFLKEFSDVMTRIFLVFAVVLDTPHEMLKEYAKECKIKPNLDEISAEAQNIALIFDKENNEFKERILDLIEGANIKFYLEDFKIKVKKFLVCFLIVFVKFVEICLILMFVYSLNFLDFLCISFEVDAIDKRFKVSAPAVLAA